MTSFDQAVLDKRAQYSFFMTEDERAEFSEWLKEMGRMSVDMVRARAAHQSLAVTGVVPEGQDYVLSGFIGAEPVYDYTENFDAAVSTAAFFVRQDSNFDEVFGPDVDGTGYFVNVNDSGQLYPHLEFRNADDTDWRYEDVDKAEFSEHGTHVSGTIGAKGLDPQAKGMAPGVFIYSMFNQELHHVAWGMSDPTQYGHSVVGNTSMGGYTFEINGLYVQRARAFDQALFDAPYYQHFYSAGNYGGTDGLEYGTIGRNNKASKNVLLVGNVYDVARDENGVRTEAVRLYASSSCGPMRDGRIKPDIVANGYRLYSPNTETEYKLASGCSMSTPNAAGSAVLLQDYFGKRSGGGVMRASTLRALIIHGAEDVGTPGPDYKFGWGLMNTLESARFLQNHFEDPARFSLAEALLQEGETTNRYCYYSGGEPIKITMSWTDPPGDAQSDREVRVPALKNDLNVRLIAPDGEVHLPYIMPFVVGQGDLPPFHDDLCSAPAIKGTNHTDLTIQISVEDIPEGLYTLEVSHDGTLTGEMQWYSLLSEGLTFIPAEDIRNLEYQAGAGGYISGPATQKVAHARDAWPVTAVPELDAEFSGWNDGATTHTRTDTNVTENMIVKAAFGSPSGVPIAWYDEHELRLAEGQTWEGLDQADSDGDGLSNAVEYMADTHPMDTQSVLRMKTGFQNTPDGSIQLTWQGGVRARQILEWTTNIMVKESWQALFTNEPPTESEVSYIDMRVHPDGPVFYRILTTRPGKSAE